MMLLKSSWTSFSSSPPSPHPSSLQNHPTALLLPFSCPSCWFFSELILKISFEVESQTADLGYLFEYLSCYLSPLNRTQNKMPRAMFGCSEIFWYYLCSRDGCTVVKLFLWEIFLMSSLGVTKRKRTFMFVLNTS